MIALRRTTKNTRERPTGPNMQSIGSILFITWGRKVPGTYSRETKPAANGMRCRLRRKRDARELGLHSDRRLSPRPHQLNATGQRSTGVSSKVEAAIKQDGLANPWNI
jgi:hypothetical protein